MDYTFPVGRTSVRIPVFIQNSAAGDGSGLTGLTNGTTGLACYYWRADQGNTGATSVALQSATRGTFTSAGFVEKDSTNQPGEYEFGVPNAAIASGADWVVFMFTGSTIGVVPKVIAIQLVANPAFAKNTALSGFQFVMFNSSGVPTTGLTVSGHVSLDGAAFASLTNSVTEIANGWYTVNLAAADLNGNTVGLRFSATGANDTEYTFVMQPLIP